jgi:hypothetical protein
LQPAVDLDGVATDNFAIERFGQCQAKLAFSGACWTQDGNYRGSFALQRFDQ